MMAPTHLAATLLAAYALSRLTPWDGRLWALALAFGVLVDVDHALNLPRYVAAHGAAGLNVGDMLAYGNAWRGPLHGPWGVALALAAAVALRTPVPLLFLGLHLFLDFKVAREWVPWGSPQEWMVLGALTAALALAAAWEAWRAGHPWPHGYWLERLRAAAETLIPAGRIQP